MMTLNYISFRILARCEGKVFPSILCVKINLCKIKNNNVTKRSIEKLRERCNNSLGCFQNSRDKNRHGDPLWLDF